MGLRDTGINRTEATALLIRDVKRILDDGDPLDLVLFTGDLVQSGQAQQFDELEKFVLEPLWRELGLPDDVPLLAVPGNHDLLRPDETTEPFAQSLVDEPAEIWKRGTKAYQFITERFAAYDNWWTNRWRGHARAHSLKLGMFPGDYLFTFEKNDVPFGFAGLNSAVTHLRNASAGELSISSAQLSELGDISSWLSNHAFNVLLTHHPSEWLTEGCRTSELANGICVPKFDLHLFGHMHEARILSSGDETRLQRTIQAASLFGRETWLRPTGKHREAVQRQFGYSLATLELRANRASFRICPRAAVKAHDHSYRFAPDPTYELKEFDPLFAEPFGPSFASAAAHRIKIETTVATLHSTPPAPPAWSSWIEGWQVWSRVEDPVERTKWRTFSQTVAEIWSRDWQTLCDAIPNDPWRDDTFAGRILDQLASLKPTKLSGKHAALLCLAPFLHEASCDMPAENWPKSC